MAFHFRRIMILVALLALILIAYFARLGFSKDVVPPEFRDAREQGSVISQDIVNISNNISKDLSTISDLDKSGRHQEALEKNIELIQRIPELKTKATDLSKDLEKMAGALPKIKSDDARQDAIQAITNRMALISRLFSYSNYLLELSNVLRDHFRDVPNTEEVNTLINQINAEVTAINSFNHAASDAMTRFDQEVVK